MQNPSSKLSSTKLSFFAIGILSLLLSACADDSGSVVTLDKNPELEFGLPTDLLDDDFFEPGSLRPVVSLSNGEVLTMVPDTLGESWSGTVNVRTNATYIVTETWVEFFEGEDLRLMSRTFELVVGADGSVEQSVASGYGVGFDFDGDGPSNLEERRNGTHPRVDDAEPPSPDTGDSSNSENSNNEGNVVVEQGTDLQGIDTDLSDSTANETEDSGEPAESENDEQDVDSQEAEDETEQESLPVTVDVVIPRISQSDAPQIDGFGVTLGDNSRFTGEWAQAIQSDDSGAMLKIDNLMVDTNAETLSDVPHRRWAAMHDGEFLYVVVIVDDDGQRERDSGDDLYDDDSLELYLDGDNSKSSEFGGDDFHRLFPLREAGAGASKVGVTSGDAPGINSTSIPVSIDFATGPGIGPDGVRRANFEQDVYELRILLESAGISSDAPFGFELQVNDDDDGQERDSKWGWKHPARTDVDVDNTYLDPSFMGTLKLD